MKQTVFRYGLYAAIVVIITAIFNTYVTAKNADYFMQEVAGYLAILISMIFVFLGIRYYRDHFNNGLLSFGQGLKIGILIVLIPAVFFGLFNLLYTKVLDPTWLDTYYNHYVERIKQTTAVDKQAAEIESLLSQKELFSNPILMFLLMTATVLVVGFIVTIISSLTLMRKKKTIA